MSIARGLDRRQGMKRLILKMSLSIDGFVGGPNGEMDWVFRSMSPDGKQWVGDTLREASVHVMGSRTYADMAAYWPSSTDPLAAPMNEIPKVVFSRSGNVATTTRALADAKRSEPLEGAAASWQRPRIASGDLAEEIARLTREPGKDIVAHGGAAFARSLVVTGLIDEYRLVVHPVALGRGLSLFGDLPKPLHLGLVGSTRFSTGAVAQVLRPL